MGFRVLPGLLGAFFLLQGLMWLFSPTTAAEGVGLPLLEGTALSTQIGDLAAFFLCLGGFAVYGAIFREPTPVRCAAALVGLAAFTRTIAWAAHGADFTAQYIAIELVCGILLLLSAGRLREDSGGHEG